MLKKLNIGILFTILSLNLSVFTQVINQNILNKILQRAKTSGSDSVLIIKDGKIIGEYYEVEKGLKMDIMSCTKSVVSLAIGKLIDDGKIKSIDQPVYEFYPEWKQGRKAFITVKHLLNHTSGLQNVADTGVEIYKAKDFIKLALAAELSDNSGTKFSYNNKAVNLLAGIIQVASGKRMDKYIADEIFAPLEIKSFDWTLDEAGNPHGMAGLQISAEDFIKFGQLVLNRGKWNGKQIISEKWIDESLSQSQPFEEGGGLLWWRMTSEETFTIDEEQFQKLENAGIDKDFLEKLKPIKEKIYKSGDQIAAITEIFGKDWQPIVTRQMSGKNVRLFKRIVGKINAYNTNGSHGQYLVIFPEKNLVAVRQARWQKTQKGLNDSFPEFISLILQLTK